jgi:hypothetical protein
MLLGITLPPPSPPPPPLEILTPTILYFLEKL